MEITVKVFLSISFSNAKRSDVFTIEDEAKELAAMDCANNFIEVWTD